MKCFEFLGRTLSVPSDNLTGAGEMEAITLIPDGELDSESGSVDDGWSNCAPYPPQSRYGRVHISRRLLRSRSSPVRAVEEQKGCKVRNRSPSVCSPRRRAKDRIPRNNQALPDCFMSSEYTIDSDTPSEDYLPTCNSYWCGPGTPCGTAYFTLRPPAVPLRLVPIVTPTQPPLPPPMYTGVKRVARVSFAKLQKRGNKESDSTVRGLLRDLVASLPLQARRKPAVCASHMVYTLHEQEERTAISSRSYVKIRPSTMPPLPIGDSEQVQRASIAIQAKSAQDDNTSDNSQQNTEVESGPPEEWLGGVRALRDSHVRLVLRQLRHIDRLNRALDRAARPSPLPPPSTRVPSSHTPTHTAATAHTLV